MSDLVGNPEDRLSHIEAQINSISENQTKIKVSFEFTRSLTSHTGNLRWACAHIYFRKEIGVRLLEQVP